MGRRRQVAVVLLIVVFWHVDIWGTARAQEKYDEGPLNNFIEKVLPALRTLSNEELQLNKAVKDLRERSDMLAFTYMTALSRLRKPTGAWDDNVRRETGLFIYMLCPLVKYLGLPPKDVKYQTEMMKIRPAFYTGAFERTVAQLSVRPEYYRISYETTAGLKEFPAVETFVNVKWMGRVEEARRKLDTEGSTK